jgi:hypothetical protein
MEMIVLINAFPKINLLLNYIIFPRDELPF